MKKIKGSIVENKYKHILKKNIHKVLSLYNTDKISPTYGYADREYWAWKTKDFANGTLQGAVHSLAIALKLNLFLSHQKEYILDIIDSSIMAVEKICDNNGALVEAYPRENSFCVTALVAFDILSAVKHLDNEISPDKKKEYISKVAPLIKFITHNDEEHAIISNHLATAYGALALWNHLTGAKNQKESKILALILKNQSNEGWYKEYEGADPGYQTLCTYYLFCGYEVTKSTELLKSLKKSANMLYHFVHPDGTIGGLYGSRNTEVYYPGGIVSLSNKIMSFAAIAQHLEPNEQHVLPGDIDIGNYIPLLNSYSVAALHYEGREIDINSHQSIPFYASNSVKDYSDAGIYLFSNKNYLVIINYKKGGTIKVFDNQKKVLDFEDGGVFGELENGSHFSTQCFDPQISFKKNKIRSRFYKVNNSLPSPLSFLILRLFSLTIFRSVFLGNLFKKLIVRMLMTGKNKIDGNSSREFIFTEEKVIVKEAIIKPKKCKWVSHCGKVKAIHMASSGYFLKQDFQGKKSSLVEFVSV